MRVIFVHDHIFKRKHDVFYSPGGLPSSVWARYLKVFDNLTVVGRDGGFLSDQEKGYTISSTDRVVFKLFPNVSNIKYLLLGNSDVKKSCKYLIEQHDCVIARLPSRLGQLFVREAIRQGKPYAVEVVGCAWNALWNYGNWKGKVFAPFATYILKNTVSKAPFTLYVTEHFLQERYPCKNGLTTFCSNVEVPEVLDLILEKRLKKIRESNIKFIFGLIGNYSSKYKGIDVAIRALAMADPKLPSWEFQVLGSGDSQVYSELANELGIANKVKFVGSLPSGQPVYNWIDEVDLYLQPSLTEGLPRALIEVMSRGCPAVGSSVGGIPELLPLEKMVIAGYDKSLSEKLISLSSDKDQLVQMASENFVKAKSYYNTVLDERRTTFWLSFKNHCTTVI